MKPLMIIDMEVIAIFIIQVPHMSMGSKYEYNDKHEECN